MPHSRFFIPRARRFQVTIFLIILLAVWAIVQTVLANSIYIVDAGGGDHSAIALNGSLPVISYYDRINQDLKIAFCGDAACTTYKNTTKTLDSTGNVGTSSAIILINDKPVIAYVDYTNADLKVVACNDARCSLAPTITTIDTNLNLTAYISMTVLAGNPVISYFGGSQDLMVAACNNPACTSSTLTPVDTTGTVGVGSSIMILNGNPVIAYNDFSNADLKVAACSDATCSTAPTLTTVDATGSVGSWISMTAINGNPIISYSSSSPAGMKVAACNDPACSSPATITNLDNAASANGTAISIVNGLPVIAYGGGSGQGYPLKLATCDNTACTSATLTSITGLVDGGRYPAMVTLNNQPAISYFDPRKNQFRFYFGGDEGYGLTTTPTPSMTITPTWTPTLMPTAYATPAQVGTLISTTSANNDNFGYAVAVSGDTIVAGAPNRDSSGLVDSGAAYVYQWNGGFWEPQQELLPDDLAAGDQFGSSVGIYGDTIIVGAFCDDSAAGAAYIFTRSGSTWTQQQKLTAPTPTAGDSFGHAVAISVESVIIGANGDDASGADAGAAYVFTRSGSTWTQQQKLLADVPIVNSQFGFAVDIYGDTAVIGAPQPASLVGSAYAFFRDNGVWTQQQMLAISTTGHAGDGFGSAVSVYNESIVVGVPYYESGVVASQDYGIIQVYNRANGVWTADTSYTYAIPTGAPSTTPQWAGFSVDAYRESYLSGVPYGRQLMSGPFPGFAAVDARSGGSVRFNWVISTPSSNGSQFGWSVARDGSVAVVGAPADELGDQTDTGAAYIFQVVAPPWEATASLTPAPSPTITPTLTPSYTPTSVPNVAPGQNYFITHFVTLTWNRVLGAAGYQVQLDDAPDFKTLLDTQDVSGDTLHITTYALDSGTYYWRVCAKNSAGKCGAWSLTQSFIVAASS